MLTASSPSRWLLLWTFEMAWTLGGLLVCKWQIGIQTVMQSIGVAIIGIQYTEMFMGIMEDWYVLAKKLHQILASLGLAIAWFEAALASCNADLMGMTHI